MDFFNKVSANVSQKAKDVSGITKLTLQIRTEEDNIKKTYSVLGEAYYNNVKNGAEINLDAMIGEITRAKQAIAECQEQITELKGVAICPNCNAELERGAKFCQHCGKPMPEIPVQPQGNVCAGCGAPMVAGAKFCTKCGTKVEN